MNKPDWYRKGLRFQCTGCGNCCTGSAGYVWVSPDDVRRIAEHLEMTQAAFKKRYTRLVRHLLCLVDQPSHDCIFLTDDKRCSINDAKPRQCLTYPFWPRLTASRKNWRQTAERCPGIGSGPLFSKDEVDRVTDRDTSRDELCRILRKKS